MNTTLSIAVSALVAGVLNAACVGEASAQPFADSTGGSSQIHGELVPTPAGIVPVASSSHSARTSLRTESSVESTFQRYADSTGGSSVASAERGLEAAGDTAPARGTGLASAQPQEHAAR